MLAQLDSQYKILTEFETEESDEYPEMVFGDGQAKKYRNRIIIQEKVGDSLKLHLVAKSHEIGELFSSAEMGHDTLYLQFRVKPEIIDGYKRVEIDYYFTYREIEMTVVGVQQMPAVIYLNEDQIELTDEVYLTFPEKYELDGQDTINRIDQYGQKQGKWVEKFYRTIHESFFEDSKILQGVATTFYPSGAIKTEETIVTDFRKNPIFFRGYFESGKLAEENYRVGEAGTYKVKWHRNGNKYQEYNFDGELIYITEYDEEGNLTCKCETGIGVDDLKGKTNCYLSNEFMIPCTFYDEEGKSTGEKNKLFKLHYDILPGSGNIEKF